MCQEVEQCVVQQEWAASKALCAVAKGKTSLPACSLTPTACPQVGWVCESGNPKHPGDTWGLLLIWQSLEMRRASDDCWVGRRYGKGQEFIVCFAFSSYLLINSNDGSRAAKSGAGSQVLFCSSSFWPPGKDPCLCSFVVCFLFAQKGKADLIFNMLFHCKILSALYWAATSRKGLPCQLGGKKKNGKKSSCFSILLLELALSKQSLNRQIIVPGHWYAPFSEVACRNKAWLKQASLLKLSTA